MRIANSNIAIAAGKQIMQKTIFENTIEFDRNTIKAFLNDEK